MKLPDAVRLTAAQKLALGFALIILIGTFCLRLPLASRDSQPIPWLDALFTATSATCVTGLVVYDTWTQFSAFGQLVILILIQIGGLGFMTLAILGAMVLGRRIGLRERSYLAEAISALHLGGVVKLARRILIGTLLLETGGAILLALRFVPRFGIRQGIWFGVFHSVSAFCNAGFDLMGALSPFSSLTGFAHDPVVNLTVMFLIISGGIGFVVWNDLFQNRLRARQYSLHTQLTLTTTAALLALGTLLFFLLERDGVLSGMTGAQKWLAAAFAAVTPRTAGFNTVPTESLGPASSLLTMLLMLIGAGAGSTAGGIKTTLFAVLILAVVAHVRRCRDVNVFKRRLSAETVAFAFCAIAFYLILAIGGGFLLMAMQSLPLQDALFESFSALGTVGLTTGITRQLEPSSRLVIIFLMFAGRVGSLKVFMSYAERNHLNRLRKPLGQIVG